LDIIRERATQVLAPLDTIQELMCVEARVWSVFIERTGSATAGSASTAPSASKAWSSFSDDSSPWLRICEAVLSKSRVEQLNASCSTNTATVAATATTAAVPYSSPRVGASISGGSSTYSFKSFEGLDLWSLVFAQVILARAKAIIELHFDSLSITQAVSTAIASLQQQSQAQVKQSMQHQVLDLYFSDATDPRLQSELLLHARTHIQDHLGNFVWEHLQANKLTQFTANSPIFVNNIKSRAQGVPPAIRYETRYSLTKLVLLRLLVGAPACCATCLCDGCEQNDPGAF
jgi:hypothetical protein